MSFENSNFSLCNKYFLFIDCKQLAYSICLVLISLQILQFHCNTSQYFQHCCYGRYYIKYIYTHGRCLYCIPQVQDLQRNVKMRNNMKLSLGNRFHSSLLTLEIHLISFQKIPKLFSSPMAQFYFNLLSCPPNSGMAKRPFYIISWLIQVSVDNTFYRNVIQILDE